MTDPPRNRSRPRVVWGILLALLPAAVLVVWVRGYYIGNSIGYVRVTTGRNPRGAIFHSHLYGIHVARGTLGNTVVRSSNEFGSLRPGWRSHRWRPDPMVQPGVWRDDSTYVDLLGWLFRHERSTHTQTTTTYAEVPLWFV